MYLGSLSFVLIQSMTSFEPGAFIGSLPEPQQPYAEALLMFAPLEYQYLSIMRGISTHFLLFFVHFLQVMQIISTLK